MSFAMSTRNLSNAQLKLHSCTEFQLHISQVASPNKILVDFTEKRLMALIDKVPYVMRKVELSALLHDYVKGNIAIAWTEGEPRYIRMTKEIT